MKNTAVWIAVQVERNGKWCAYTIRADTSSNIVSRLDIPGIKTANIFPTKKQSDMVCNNWNQGFIRDNKYLYS